MKKILMAAVALICMTMTSVVFTSCGDDKDDPKTVVYYKYADVESVRVVSTEEGQAQAKEFVAALTVSSTVPCNTFARAINNAFFQISATQKEPSLLYFEKLGYNL